MSKTDKTHPVWVGRQWKPEHGAYCVNRPDTRHGTDPCDLPAEPPNRHINRWNSYSQPYTCCWWPDLPNYYAGWPYRAKAYSRPRSIGCVANRTERGIRCAWRNTRQALLAAGRNDVDDIELPDPRHRHYALWDAW